MGSTKARLQSSGHPLEDHNLFSMARNNAAAQGEFQLAVFDAIASCAQSFCKPETPGEFPVFLNAFKTVKRMPTEIDPRALTLVIEVAWVPLDTGN